MYPPKFDGSVPELFMLIFAGLIGFLLLGDGSVFEFQKEVSKYTKKPLKVLAGIGSISRLIMVLSFLSFVALRFFEFDKRPVISSEFAILPLVVSIAVGLVVELYLIWKTHDTTGTIL